MLQKLKAFLLLLLLFFFQSVLARAEALIHHEMRVVLQPGSSKLGVEDRITLPQSRQVEADGRIYFMLHKGLAPKSSTAGVIITRAPKPPVNRKLPISTLAESYAVKLPVGLNTFTLKYQGQIHHPLSGGDESMPGVEASTPGIISPEGTFLSGETFWYPVFDQRRMTFSLDIELPSGWNAVSQGARRYKSGMNPVLLRWESPEPQEEIFLVAGQWTEYLRDAGRVGAMVFLRTPDQALAEEYLKVTEQYINMYEDLIGPYPYKKFALVENFWETGYGMPSFTLLGSKVIRLPFILHSSYPHEILHNWWGNGVYVDLEKGNWSEGLTSYLADYLIQEQEEKGLAARRASLQRYADYVLSSRDFPLTQFRARHDAASQAVGYGKTMFLFHMLRRELGDASFLRALQLFYETYKYRAASFDDLQRSFSRVAGKDLKQIFDQWVTQTGAPVLRVTQARAVRDEGGYLLTAQIKQQQPGAAYALKVPIAVTLEGSDAAYQTVLEMHEKTLSVSLRLPSRPTRLIVDPEFDLFRRLHPAEMPPSLSRAFGADSSVIILPAAANEDLRQGYQELAERWKTAQPEKIEVMWDNEVKALPDNSAVWVFGWENRFQRTVLSQLKGYNVIANSAITRIGPHQIPKRNHSLVLSTHHPQNRRGSLTWLATDNPRSLPGLARKLPHYGSFGILGFKGNDPTNVARGKWPVIGSPMSLRVSQPDDHHIDGKQGKLALRNALTILPPLFSGDRMSQDISFLAHNDLKGRGFGSPELDKAAEYIAASFRRSGLMPAGVSGRSYLQQWKGAGKEVGSGVLLTNVVGIIPGIEMASTRKTVVIGAHYDHLGFGWPSVQGGDEGRLHPGANDNASGIALLLELAKILKKGKPLRHSIVFVAFTGGEVGHRGARHFIASKKTVPPEKIIGMLNLDTIGQLGQQKVMILGDASSREWPPLLRKAGASENVLLDMDSNGSRSSDQVIFHNAGIPAIQFSSGITPDTTRPGDTSDKIDKEGLVTIGRLVKEVVLTLAMREAPLAFTPIPSKKEERPSIWQTLFGK